MAPPGLGCQVQLYFPLNANHLSWTQTSLCSSKKLPLSLEPTTFLSLIFSYSHVFPPAPAPYPLNYLSKKKFLMPIMEQKKLRIVVRNWGGDRSSRKFPVLLWLHSPHLKMKGERQLQRFPGSCRIG